MKAVDNYLTLIKIEIMNYEEKYKEALGRAKKLAIDGYLDAIAIDDIFPELKESEDERIRKAIHIYLDWLDGRKDYAPKGIYSIKDMIAWLEKQSNNKVEPKFHEGDWFVNNETPHDVFCVIEVLEEIYKVIDIDGDDYHIPHCKADKQFHLWTIDDAKDGDVLMTTKARNCPFIYRKTDYNNNLAYYYAGVDGDGDFCEGCLKRTMYHFGSVSNVVPATKEQRDLLFAKMKEAGYEWDANKKELKKVEPKMLNFV